MMRTAAQAMREGGRRWPRLAWPALVFALVLLAQLPLLRNPGYFSHDELQWAAWSAQGVRADWTAIGDFQYRPLTFALWLWLSRHLFASPQALHALLVAWGAGNAALLCALGRRLGLAPATAAAGALAFALGPYAMYVHGWVGTLADLAWVGCALLAGWSVARWPRPAPAALLAALLTTLALLAKEAAVVLPALFALAWWFDRRQRHWAAAALASGAVVAGYLALRLPALLHAPRDGALYVPGVAHVPWRWLEYQLYPLLPTRFEAATTLARGIGGSLVVAAALWLALVAALWRSQPWLCRLFLAGGVAALAPVLLLGASWNHYAYGFSALAAMTVAAAWRPARAGGRIVFALVALLWLWHGANVMRTLRHVGEVQAVFSPALADALRDTRGGLRLRLPGGPDDWIYARLTHDIPRYDGVAVGARVRLVAPGAPADFAITGDGRLRPLR